MKKYILAIIIIIIVLLVVLGIYRQANRWENNTPISPLATSSVISDQNIPVGQALYSDKFWGFSLVYPATMTPETAFKAYYHLSTGWRAEISPEDATGTPLVSFPVYRVENAKTYPRYFAVEVRVGASQDQQTVKNCLQPGYASGSASSTTEIINGIPFTVFTLQGAGMMQYLEGTSYRTVHNNTCFVLEKLKVGSSYRDATSSQDIPDTVLDSYYQQADPIIKSFRFGN